MNITAIIFDLGGVILDISFERTQKAFEKLGVENFERMYTLKDVDPLFRKLEEGKIRETEFYEAFRQSSGKQISDADIRASWNSLLLQFRPGTLSALKKLKKKYKLFLLSNTNTIHREAFNRIFLEQVGNHSLDQYFDKAYFSYDIGVRKPDVEAYEYVLKENHLLPSETLFIDDSLTNIEAAGKAGLQVIHLTDEMRVEDLDL